MLPVYNEDHMPHKEKPQPSENQIALLQWWISQGAEFGKKVKDINQPEKIGRLLLALQKPIITEKAAMDIPDEVVEKADGSVIEQMKQRGITVLPLAQNNNWLSVNFVIDKKVNAEVLQ